jgi:hypothetical protein
MEIVDLSHQFPKNTPFKGCNSNCLKNWQRVIACLATQEVYERHSMTNVQKYENCRAAYSRHAKLIHERFKEDIHEHFQPDVLERATLNGTGLLTGKQIWDIWESTNREISNVYLPEWLRFTKGGRKINIPSGKTLDDVVLDFRKHLFHAIKESNKQLTSSASTATKTTSATSRSNATAANPSLLMTTTTTTTPTISGGGTTLFHDGGDDNDDHDDLEDRQPSSNPFRLKSKTSSTMNGFQFVGFHF